MWIQCKCTWKSLLQLIFSSVQENNVAVFVVLLKKFKLTLTRSYDLLPGGCLVELVDSFVDKFDGKHLKNSIGREVKNLMNLKL